MKPKEQRIAIAEACGWTETGAAAGWAGRTMWVRDGHYCITDELPDYPTDLYAMFDAEGFLTMEQLPLYEENIARIQTRTEVGAYTHHQRIRATAAQRAEAFLRTIGKWKE